MAEAITRNSALFIGMILAAVVCAPAASWAVFHTGAPAPGVFQAESAAIAVLMTLVLMSVASLVAGLAGRLSNAAIGMFVLGAGVFVLARRMGSVEELVFGGGSLLLIAAETLFWAFIVFGATFVVFRVAGPLDDIEPDAMNRRPHPLFSREAVVMFGAGALMLVVVWIFAQSSMKGQVLGATFLGGVAAGLTGRLVSPHVQPLLLFAAPVVFGAAGQFVGAVMLTGPADVAFVNRQLSAINLPMPADYAAGALLGVSFGLGWAKSFLQHDESEVKAAA